ncbi:hypothetical protein [Streptomyces asoensis]
MRADAFREYSGVLAVAQAPGYVREYGWGHGLWNIFEDTVDP